MKSAVIRAFDQPLAIEDVTIDPPKAGEVRVQVAACAVCHSDIHFAEGSWGGTPPLSLGHEASGVVAETGPGVTSVAVGDHVVISLIRHCGTCFFCARGEQVHCEASFALDSETRVHDKDGNPITQGIKCGTFAEETVVHESQLVVIPKDLPMDCAALLGCGVITGAGAVTNTARVPAGASVAVIGTGGVGLNSIQGAHLSGAHPVIAIDLSDEKLDAAKRFGATHGINPRTNDAVEAVRALTGGRGADYVLVTVGSAAAMEQAVGLIRTAGTVVLVGLPASGIKVGIEAANFASSGQTVIGNKMGATRPRIEIPKLVELYRDGRLKLDELITGRYRLDEINEAFASVNRGAALRNVVMF